MPSRPRNDPIGVLESLVRRKRVVTLDDLRRALAVRSRTTILGVLHRAGYLSSYSHAGKYYTLSHIPAFDERGLWFHGDVRFSKHRTLRATVVVLVEEAPAGHTHDELALVLGLRVHDTLRSLVEAKEIGRERIHAVYVYVAADPERAGKQLERRREAVRPVEEADPGTGETGAPPSPLDLQQVIEVLVAVIQAPKDDARRIAARLCARGADVSAEQVEAVLGHYGVVKKTARSRSRRSRR